MANGRAWRTLFQKAPTVWPGQRPARRVRDRAADDDRDAVAELLEERFDGEDRGLAVERVEDRLDEQNVRAALDQAARRVVVGVDQFLPRDVAGAGVVDVGRDRRGFVGRAQRAGDEAWSVGRFVLVCRGAGDRGGGPVHLFGVGLQRVIGQRNRVGVEGVRADDVGTGVEILAVDAGDDLGLGQRQQVVLAAQVARMVGEALAAEVGLGQLVTLDERAHRAVEHEDALAQKLGQAGVAVVSGAHSVSSVVSRVYAAGMSDALRPAVDHLLAAWSGASRRRPRAGRALSRGRRPDRLLRAGGQPLPRGSSADRRRSCSICCSDLAQPEDVWLDVGAGGGRYALPMALRVA